MDAALRAGPVQPGSSGGRRGLREGKRRAIRILIGVGAVAGSFGCAMGPIWAKSVSGQVVDRDTGAPVSDAVVLYSYEESGPREGGGVSGYVCSRHTTTDREGRFHFGGRLCVAPGFPAYWSTASDPGILVLHHDYEGAHDGFPWVVDSPGRGGLIRARRGDNPILSDPEMWGHLCREANEETCNFLCEWAYGSLEACAKAGRKRGDSK